MCVSLKIICKIPTASVRLLGDGDLVRWTRKLWVNALVEGLQRALLPFYHVRIPQGGGSLQPARGLLPEPDCDGGLTSDSSLQNCEKSISAVYQFPSWCFMVIAVWIGLCSHGLSQFLRFLASHLYSSLQKEGKEEWEKPTSEVARFNFPWLSLVTGNLGNVNLCLGSQVLTWLSASYFVMREHGYGGNISHLHLERKG